MRFGLWEISGIHIDEGQINYSRCTQGLSSRGRTSKLLSTTLVSGYTNLQHNARQNFQYFILYRTATAAFYMLSPPPVYDVCVSCRSPVHRGSPVKPHRGELETSQWLEATLQRSIAPLSPPPITCSARHLSTFQEETDIIPQLI